MILIYQAYYTGNHKNQKPYTDTWSNSQPYKCCPELSLPVSITLSYKKVISCRLLIFWKIRFCLQIHPYRLQKIMKNRLWQIITQSKMFTSPRCLCLLTSLLLNVRRTRSESSGSITG